MSVFRQGRWRIDSVLVNTETVLDNQGFLRIEIEKESWAIMPVGFRFKINETSGDRAVLEMQGSTYVAEFKIKDDRVQLKLTRPEFDEVIRIKAEYDPVDVSV